MSQYNLNNKYGENAQMELPKIHQTLFIVDQNRQYLFDVNQNITIKNILLQKEKYCQGHKLSKMMLNILMYLE